MRRAFVTQVIGHGQHWTHWIKRRVGKLPEGDSVDWMTLYAEAMEKAEAIAEGAYHG